MQHDKSNACDTYHTVERSTSPVQCPPCPCPVICQPNYNNYNNAYNYNSQPQRPYESTYCSSSSYEQSCSPGQSTPGSYKNYDHQDWKYGSPGSSFQNLQRQSGSTGSGSQHSNHNPNQNSGGLGGSSESSLGSSTLCSDEEWFNTHCCAPCQGVCSENPNCHMLKDPCAKKCPYPGVFPSPFRLKSVQLPSWLANCGKVLRFYGFYQEAVPESGIENYRIHQCEIRFYLADNQIEVYEPKTYDPGFTQGLLIRKGRIPFPSPAHHGFYELEDIIVGCEVTFYGKTFLVTGCDDLTRKYLNRLGKAVPPNLEMPEDPYTVWRQDRVTSLFSRKAQINMDQDKFKRFLANNGKVLRFWAYWDNRSYDGNLRQFIVHYFLEDNTVEIKEITDPEGRIRGAVAFLGKGKLLKNHKDLVPTTGIKEEALLVLNTAGFNRSFMATSYLPDRLCPGIDEKEFVTDKDLAIGAVLNVYGRPFILTDCDKATQTYYREKYGIEDFTPLVLTNDEVGQPVPKMDIPPHIGIGDEVDTLLNWDKLEPHQPKRDELALITREKDVLGFEARLDKPLNKVNGDRRFIIKIHMIDNTMTIFEKEHPNTGLSQGKQVTFLSRSKVRKNTPRFELGDSSEYYEPWEYFVGNILDVNGFRFLLTSADEFTFNYMDSNPHLSDLCRVLDKVKEAIGMFREEDLLKIFSEKDSKLMGIIDASEFRCILIHLTKASLNEHELSTILRAFRVNAPEVPPDLSTLQAVIQTELQKHGFDKYMLERVEYTMRYHDPCKTGLLDRETVRSTLRGARLPIQRELIDFLVDNFERADDCDRVNYCCIMKFMDHVDNGVPQITPTSINCVLKHLQAHRPYEIVCLNYHAFLEQICPTLKCALASFCCPPKQEECQPTCPPVVYDDTECEPDERDLAGQVISDNRITPERFRCLEEDEQAEGGNCIDFGEQQPGSNVRWTSNDFDNVDPCLLEAYRPNEEEGCDDAYKPGDYITWQDFDK